MKALLLAPLFCVACGTVDPLPGVTPSSAVDAMTSRALAVYAAAGHPVTIDYPVGVGALPSPTMFAACATWKNATGQGRKIIVSSRLLNVSPDLQTYVMIHEIAHCSFNLPHVAQEQGQIMSPYAPDWATPLDGDAWVVFWEQVDTAEQMQARFTITGDSNGNARKVL